MCNNNVSHGVTFDLGSASTPTLKRCFSYHKAMCIAETNLIVLLLLTAILQLINRSINKFYSFITFSLQINADILILCCLVLKLLLYIHFLFLEYYFSDTFT